jgi:threonine-phosphate decarboxylase
MSRYQHGGGIHQAAAELQRPVAELLDFSASINPLGMPTSVRAAAAAALDDAIHYPEIHAESLVAALAAYHHLDPRHFLAGNGSTPLFTLFAQTLRPRRALVVRPAFSEYQRALEIAGTAIDVFDLYPEQDFTLDLPPPSAGYADDRPPPDCQPRQPERRQNRSSDHPDPGPCPA